MDTSIERQDRPAGWPAPVSTQQEEAKPAIVHGPPGRAGLPACPVQTPSHAPLHPCGPARQRAGFLPRRSAGRAQIEPSQRGTVSQRIADLPITLDCSQYRRPRGRELFGALVPYGKIWCPCADDATTIELTAAVKIDGHELAAGQSGSGPCRTTASGQSSSTAWRRPGTPSIRKARTRSVSTSPRAPARAWRRSRSRPSWCCIGVRRYVPVPHRGPLERRWRAHGESFEGLIRGRASRHFPGSWSPSGRQTSRTQESVARPSIHHAPREDVAFGNRRR